MQGLVYIFIGLAAFALGLAGYFGLTFTPIESLLLALAALALFLALLERTLRRRAEARLEQGIEDLSRLLSTDAQAGQVLSQRINALTDIDAGTRLDVVEADVSVLGTVTRQIAEAVAELEEARARAENPRGAAPAPTLDAVAVPAAGQPAEPVIPVEMLRQALEEDRLVHHMQPIVTLPQRRTHGYDLLPRLLLEDGELADAPDFMPLRSPEGAPLVRRVERMSIEEAITIARRARTGGAPITLYVPVSRRSLDDRAAVEQIVALLDANRAVNDLVALTLAEEDWRVLAADEKAALAAMVKKGVSVSLAGARSLRFDYADLAGAGVASIRVDASRFIAQPAAFTDFHTSDIAAYVNRFGVDLIMTGVGSEEQILSLLDDGVGLAQGPHISGPAPIRPDLLLAGTPLAQVPRRAGV